MRENDLLNMILDEHFDDEQHPKDVKFDNSDEAYESSRDNEEEEE